jgi:ABC-2 type transport system permease protein
MTLGGMMLPLEIFPESVERLAHVLPFQAVIYLPAKMMVTEPGGLWWSLWLKQIGWALFSLGLMGVIYRRGVRNLDLNGG